MQVCKGIVNIGNRKRSKWGCGVLFVQGRVKRKKRWFRSRLLRIGRWQEDKKSIVGFRGWFMGTYVGGRTKEMSVREQRKILRSATGRAGIIRGDCQQYCLLLAYKQNIHIHIFILLHQGYSTWYYNYYLDLENWIDKYYHLTIKSIFKKGILTSRKEFTIQMTLYLIT